MIEKAQKIDNWIHPYGIDVDGESTFEKEGKTVSYVIPSYKIGRLKQVEEENQELRNALELAEKEVIRRGENLNKTKSKLIKLLRSALESMETLHKDLGFKSPDWIEKQKKN